MTRIGPVEFDVVVVGFGAAGAVAALEAAKQNGRILLVEKMPQPGGISILSAGGLRICSDPDQAYTYLRKTNGDRAPDAILKRLSEGMYALPDYLRSLAKINGAEVRIRAAKGNYPFPGYESLGYASIEFDPELGSLKEPNCEGFLYARPLTAGCLLFKTLYDNVKAECSRQKIEIRLSTRVVRLLRAKGGEINGVLIRSDDGIETEVRTKKGVILACGGFEASEEMKRKHLIAYPVLTGSFRGNTGDGIALSQDVGADLWHMWHHHGPYGMKHSNPDFPFGLYVKALPMWNYDDQRAVLPKVAWIVVDQLAQRYENEYPPYLSDTGVRQFEYFNTAAASYVRTPSYLIFDENGRKLYPMGRSITNDATYYYEWSKDNLKEVDSGILMKANSITELADILKLDGPSLQRTLDLWNENCAAGEDRSFCRAPETMCAINQPPFFAAPIWPLVINTQGGPVHDEFQRVLDPHGRPIPHLYAVGELGSVFGHIYMAGGNLAECFIGGMVAGRHIMRDTRSAKLD